MFIFHEITFNDLLHASCYYKTPYVCFFMEKRDVHIPRNYIENYTFLGLLGMVAMAVGEVYVFTTKKHPIPNYTRGCY